MFSKDELIIIEYALSINLFAQRNFLEELTNNLEWYKKSNHQNKEEVIKDLEEEAQERKIEIQQIENVYKKVKSL